MINEKELFSIMIKYHPAIIGRLISKKICIKEGHEIVIAPNTTNEKTIEKPMNRERVLSIPGEKEGNIISAYKYGKNILELDTFLIVKTENPEIFKHFDTTIYRSLWDKDGKYYCPPSILNEILALYSETILSLSIPHGTRIPQELVPKYFEIIRRQNNYIEKYDVFSYAPIYSEIDWSFDMVEQNKDKLLWLELMQNANLLWTEEMLTKYDKYIPHKELYSYRNKDIISNRYLETHKERINWIAFVKSANYQWNPDELRKYYSRLDVSWSWLLEENRYFTWTPDTFKTMLELEPYALSRCISNNNLLNILYQIPQYEKIVNDIDPDFWHKLKDGGKRPHNSYSDYFNIENIEQNKDIWNNKIEDKFDFMKRTPDTNYHYHKLYTMWDFFTTNDNIRLDYQLCKYLNGLDVIIGGWYVLEDGHYLAESDTNQHHNGLELFSDKKFSNVDEIDKVLNDKTVLDVLMNDRNDHTPNPDISDYLIESFFSNYELEDYLSIINAMKDWDRIAR